jgi:hypothetical protein
MIDSREEEENALDSMRINSESISREIDDSDSQAANHDKIEFGSDGKC